MQTKLIWLAVVFAGLAYFICVAQPTNKQVKSDTHGPGYYIIGSNGKNIWNTNVEQFWRGVWKEDTNHWRVELNFLKINTPDVTVSVDIGSIVKNSGDGENEYYTTPDGKFAKFELLDPNGVIVRPKVGAVAAWVRAQESLLGIGVISKTQWNGSLEEDFPQHISVESYSRAPVGAILGMFMFVSNGPPSSLGVYRLHDVYSITNEGDYTLTVRPVLYKDMNGVNNIDISDRNVHVSNTNLFERMDLPLVSAKIHLMP